MDKTRKEIERIITYHSELGEGTSGYLLSNEQIDQLLALFNSNLKEEREEYKSTLLEKVRKMRCKDDDQYAYGFNACLDQIESIIGEK